MTRKPKSKRVRRRVVSAEKRKLRLDYKQVTNRWEDGDYELAVQYCGCGLDEDNIQRVAGIKYADTGYCFADNTRDLMFYGLTKDLALLSAKRLWEADPFGVLSLKITCPEVVKYGKTFTPVMDHKGKVIDMREHRERVTGPQRRKRKRLLAAKGVM